MISLFVTWIKLELENRKLKREVAKFAQQTKEIARKYETQKV